MTPYIKLLGTALNGPVRQASYVNGVSVSLGAANAPSSLTGVQYDRSAAEISYFGGVIGDLGTLFPRNLFTSTFNVTEASGSRYGLGGKIAFVTDSRHVDIQILSIGGNAECALFINGQPVLLPKIEVPSDGAPRYLKLDLTNLSNNLHRNTIEIEFQGGANLRNLIVDPGSSIYQIEDPGPRIVFLGDSFIGGFGSRTVAEDLVSLTGLGLGSLDVWQSGVGGTGWVKGGPNLLNLHDRMLPDGVNANGDLYVIAMGVNDGTGIQSAVEDALAILRAGVPSSRIIMIGPWNPGGPGGAEKPAVAAEIKAALALFPEIAYIDASRLSFTTIDGVHPDAAGHWTIAEWLTASVQRVLGADGLIDAGVQGDVVGPLFLSSYVNGQNYTYEVIENSGVPSRFEVVPGPDQFPILKLKADQAITYTGGVELTVRATDSTGQLVESTVFVRVRANMQGGEANDGLVGANSGIRMNGNGGNDQLFGGTGDDYLTGGPGNDRLDGGPGLDFMAGQEGDDTYFVDRAGDSVDELANQGSDTVYSLLPAYGLTSNIETLILLDGALKGGGNDLNNVLVGNNAENTLYGLSGDDALYGLDGNDIIYGDAGNDRLIGGAGADNMAGGLGDDRFSIEDVGDKVFEYADQGRDRVDQFIVDYVVPANVEVLEMVGSAARTAVGNDLGNVLVGNAAENVILGMGGPDILYGLGGNDRLEGGAGNDRLIGGAGADILKGGAGDDYYEVEDTADQIIELSSEGWDLVIQYATTFTLPNNVEAIDMRGGAIDAIGNILANSIYGNSENNQIIGLDGNDILFGNGGDDILEGGTGSDRLNGGVGNDTLIGGAGDDIYEISDANDLIIEIAGEGRDMVIQTIASYTLASEVEVLDMRAGAIAGSGNDLNNNIYGNELDNVLNGGAGFDRLYGRGGDDTFINSAGEDYFYGESGNDKVIFSGKFEDYSFKFVSDRLYVKNILTGEIDDLFLVEQMVFDNYTAPIDYASQIIG